jgi:hypothetical protein
MEWVRSNKHDGMRHLSVRSTARGEAGRATRRSGLGDGTQDHDGNLAICA